MRARADIIIGSLQSIPYGTRTLALPRPWSRVPVLKPRADRRRSRTFQWREPLRDRRVVILVPDNTRRCGVDRILPKLLPYLDPKKTQVIFATGIHRRQTRREQLRILGTRALRFRDAGPHYEFVGTTRRGTRVELDRDVVSADRIIGISRVALHYFAGFSGGRKLLAPGVASPETCRANHRLVLDAAAGGRRAGVGTGQLTGNPVHEDLLEAARMAPPTTLINVVGNETVVSDLDRGFARVCEKIRRAAQVKVSRPFDFILAGCGGAPYDVNFIQSHKTLEYVRGGLRDGGILILAAACPEGYGHPHFARWLRKGSAEAMARALRNGYQIYGQTAWSTREKAERYRIYMQTEMNAEQVIAMGIGKLRSLSQAWSFIESTLGPRARGAVVPFGSRTWLTG